MISVDYVVFIERNPISLPFQSSLMIGNFALKAQGTLRVISEQQSVAAGAPAKVNMLY